MGGGLAARVASRTCIKTSTRLIAKVVFLTFNQRKVLLYFWISL